MRRYSLTLLKPGAAVTIASGIPKRDAWTLAIEYGNRGILTQVTRDRRRWRRPRG